MIGSFLSRAYDRDVDYYVPAAEVEKIERARMVPLNGLIDRVDVAASEQRVA